MILVLMFALAACGGREARPVAQATALDDRFSCAHLSAEYDINRTRAADLANERGEQIRNNLGMLIVAPLFLDLSGAERREIEALAARNERLVQLSAAKGCEPPLSSSSSSSATAK